MLVLSGHTSGWASDDFLLREQDQFWLVSTRGLGGNHPATDEELPDYQIEQYDAPEGWQSADPTELLAGEGSERLLVIYVHGNRVSASEAVCKGWRAYHALLSSRDDPRGIHFVVWSWPSDQVRGPIRDIRFKARRTEFEGYLLGHFLSRVSAEQPTALLGYSFGARIVTGALHLIGGGSLSRGPLNNLQQSRCRPRVALLAAAVHSHWLNQGAYHELALTRMEALLNVYNHCDPALQRYQLVDRCSHPSALGYTGLYVGNLGDQAERVEQLDVRCIVGRSHDERRYLNSLSVRQQIQSFFLGLTADG